MPYVTKDRIPREIKIGPLRFKLGGGLTVEERKMHDEHGLAISERDIYHAKLNKITDAIEDAVYTHESIESALVEFGRDPTLSGDFGQWERTGYFRKGCSDEVSGRELSIDARDKMIEMSRHFYRHTAAGRNIIESHTSYIMGRGYTMVPLDGDDETKETIERFEEVNNLKKGKSREMVMRTFRDGTLALRLNKVDESNDKHGYESGDLLVRFFPTEYLVDIERAKEDYERIINYWRLDGDEERVSISPDDMMHYALFADSDCVWGRVLMESVMRRIQQKEIFIRGRQRLNQFRTNVVAVRQISETKSGIVPRTPSQAAGDMQQSRRRTSDSSYAKMPPGGSMVTMPPGMTLKMESPNIRASDAKDDLRALNLDMASGMQMPEFLVSGDAANSNLASTLVAESPWLMNILEYQNQFAGLLFEPMYERAIKHSFETRNITSVQTRELKESARKEGRELTTIMDKARATGNRDAIHEASAEVLARAAEIVEAHDNFETVTKEPTMQVRMDWPRLESRDPEKEARAVALDIESGILSPRTAATIRGYDYDEELQNMEDDTRYRANVAGSAIAGFNAFPPPPEKGDGE